MGSGYPIFDSECFERVLDYMMDDDLKGFDYREDEIPDLAEKISDYAVDDDCDAISEEFWMEYDWEAERICSEYFKKTKEEDGR